MTIEEKSRIKMYLDDLVEWVDEQPQEETIEDISMERDYWQDICHEAEEQRDEALKKLDEMEAKVAMLVEYLQTAQKYHMHASQYYMEKGETEQELLHGESLKEAVSCEVMCMKLFDENDSEYVANRIRMYGDMANAYYRRFK